MNESSYEGGGVTLDDLLAQSQDPGFHSYDYEDIQVVEFHQPNSEPAPELINPESVLCDPDRPKTILNKKTAPPVGADIYG